MDNDEDVERMPEIVLELGKTYMEIAYVPGIYDINVASNVEVYKITKKSYMLINHTTGKTYRVPIGSVMSAK